MNDPKSTWELALLQTMELDAKRLLEQITKAKLELAEWQSPARAAVKRASLDLTKCSAKYRGGYWKASRG